MWLFIFAHHNPGDYIAPRHYYGQTFNHLFNHRSMQVAGFSAFLPSADMSWRKLKKRSLIFGAAMPHSYNQIRCI